MVLALSTSAMRVYTNILLSYSGRGVIYDSTDRFARMPLPGDPYKAKRMRDTNLRCLKNSQSVIVI